MDWKGPFFGVLLTVEVQPLLAVVESSDLVLMMFLLIPAVGGPN